MWQLSWVSRSHWFWSGSEQAVPSGGITVNRLSIDRWSLKYIVRSCVALLAGMTAGGRAVGAVQSLEQYYAMRMTDPSRAEPYLAVATYDLSIVALSVTLAGLVWWLLRPSSEVSPTKRM